MCGIKQVIKRNGRVVDFNKDKIVEAIFKAAVDAGGTDKELADKLADEVIEILQNAYPPPSIPSVEEVQDMAEKVLIENGHAKTAKKYIVYRMQRSMVRDERDKIERPSENIPYKKLYYILNWSIENNVNTIAGLNDIIKSGHLSDLIEETNRAYLTDISNAVEKMLSRKDQVRVFIVSGPSSSGKTTSTIKVEEKLKEKGFSLVRMELDNYFWDLEKQPKDEFGDYDFETPEALDLDLINRHLEQLLAGKEIKMPFYDFKTGKMHLNRTPLKIKENEIILLDSLHGLYDRMTASVPAEKKFKTYIETYAQIKDSKNEYVRWADIRMLRRMIRDSWHRSYKPEGTLTHWHYVRRSELKYIIPFLKTVDHLVNGYLAYEFPFHKAKLFNFFPEFVEKYKNDPKRQDAYVRAQRVHDWLNEVTPWTDDDIVPKDALLREYIGGSIYKY